MTDAAPPTPTNPTLNEPELFDKVVNLCKRRGFVFPSAEIYGGFRSTYDYGPARRAAAAQREGRLVALDGAAARRRRRPRRRRSCRRPPVWEASGHLANFTDPLVDCTSCKERFRLDKLDDPDTCPSCGTTDTLHRGPPVQPDVQDPRRARSRAPATRSTCGPRRRRACSSTSRTCSRPSRKKPPFGIAQVGKSFRNEITPGQLRVPHPRVRADGDGVLRPARRGRAVVRVLVQGRGTTGTSTTACPPSSSACGPTTPTSCRTTRSGTSDVEFLFPWGWDELEGIANRGDYDLTAARQRTRASKLEYFDQATNERYVPHVIEPAAGATRTMMAFLMAAYDEEEVNGETRTVLRLHPRLAPYKVAVLPLSKKDDADAGGPTRCSPCSQPHCMCDYDETQAIGRRYRRQDEIGTPLLRHRRLRHARGPRGHRPRPRLDGAGAGADRRPARAAGREARLLMAGSGIGGAGERTRP